MVVKNSSIQMAVPTEVLAPQDHSPTNHFSKSDHNFNRKVQARGHLASHLRDRALRGGPLKWTRSLTDVGFIAGKTEDREPGSPGHMSRKPDQPFGPIVPRSATRGQQRHLVYSYNHASESSLQSSARTRSRMLSSRYSSHTKVTDGVKDGEWSQKMTLSELRKFLNTRDGGSLSPQDKPNSSMPRLHKGMSINIQRAVENYPNIALTVKQEHRTPPAGNKATSRPNHAKSRQQQEVVEPVVLPMLSIEPKNNTISKVPTKAADTKEQSIPFLNTSNLARANPEEWTKKWIQDNPLGPEINEEYIVETPPPRKTDNQDLAQKSPKTPRKVRFGTDKFLL